MDERMYWLAFSQCNGIGPAKFRMLIEHFGTAENAWNAPEKELEASGIGKTFAARVLAFKKQFSPEWYRERLQKLQVDFLILSEPAYPVLLKQIAKPPFVLYVKGNKKLLSSSAQGEEGMEQQFLAVVGTRKITDYGQQVTETLTEELARAGIVIVSGLALGVDAVAHTAALDANGKTIAVLGSGVDYCTPRENESLYNRILEQGGAIVSEVPLGQMPNKGSFPSRNRIIAGMCAGVLVTEGAEDSGSLITAANALESSRTVFAVPGPITSSVSKGTNVLLAKGAKLVTSAKDIIEVIGTPVNPASRKLRIVKGDTKEEQKIIDLLSDQQLHFDELVKRTGMNSSHVGTVLSLLEMKGVIRPLSAGFFGLDE